VTSLTATGVAIGTPAYMAPEQLAAETVDARADVFALGVTLWEALFGRRPYGGSTAKAIASAMLDGAPQPPQRVGPAIDRVPAWVARAARAAIEPDPDRRTPSMAAFVASIDVGRRDRRRNAAVVAGVALVLGGGAFALGFTRSGDAADPCTATANLVDQVWTPAREAAIERAFTAAAPEFGTTSAQRLVAGARAWTADWKLVRRAACAGPAAERARRDACLDRALAALAARADLWAAADEGVVLSTRGRTDLPVVALCASPPPRSEPLPPTLARIDDQFERVDALEYGGRHAEALEKLAAVRAELDRTTNPTFLAHAGMIAGAVLHNDGALDDALRLYDRAGAAAATIGDANATMRLLALQANALVDKGDPAAALVAINAATRVHELAQVPDPMAVIGTTRGRILLESGRGPEAITELEAAARTLAATAVTNRDANVVLAMALATQAYAMRERVERGELERSLATYAQARALVVAELGAEHPEVARIDGERALVLSDLGRGDEATALAREALAELRAAFGPGHPLVGASLVNLASLERVAGHAAAARAAADEARPILTAVLPPEHPTFAVLDTTIAKLELVDGRLPEAEAWARAAIERFDAADIGGDQLADPLLALGRILVARGRPADAVPVLQRAVIELADPSLGASRLEALLALGDALVHARRPGDARATLQEAATLAGTLELAGPDGDALRAQLAALEKALS
jgi:eukaryotic-like serine/threonine-protein kinase